VANDGEANDIIAKLNALRVRHVISEILIRELLTLGNKPHYDELLVKRLQRFELPAYCTKDWLTWQVLLSSGDERQLVADYN